MKRIAYVLLIIYMFIGSVVLAQQPTSATTGKKESSQIVCSKGCVLSWINVTSDGTNAVTVNVYDGTSTSGKLIDSTYLPAYVYSVKKDYHATAMLNGLYITVSGTNGAYYVGYISGY